MDRSDLLIQYLSLLIKASESNNPHLEVYTVERIDKVCAALDEELSMD